MTMERFIALFKRPVTGLILALLISLFACTKNGSDKFVQIAFVQINDVYEMPPVNGGLQGGLARVKSLVDEVKEDIPNTYTFFAGDLISPSAIGTAMVDGEYLNGRQMVDVLNHMGWDYFTPGNHEWDNGRETLIKRLNEARFTVVSSNVTDAITGKAFNNTVSTDLLIVDGVRIGIAGVTLQSLSKDWLKISDPFESAKQAINKLKTEQKADVVVLITHQDLAEDVHFSQHLSDVDLIIGGHEHENQYVRKGANFAPVAKADANARSAYVHYLSFNKQTKRVDIRSDLRIVDSRLNEDPYIKGIVDSWLEKAFDAFRLQGTEPTDVVAMSTDELDGLEATVRTTHSLLTDLIAESARVALPGSVASLVNGGTIRIDDILPPGEITQYDLIKIFPFSGSTYSQVTIPGVLLQQALEVGKAAVGAGSFLHYANISDTPEGYKIDGKPLNPDEDYTIAIVSFLVDSGDTGLEFLATDARISKTSMKAVDVRKAMAGQLQRTYGKPASE